MFLHSLVTHLLLHLQVYYVDHGFSEVISKSKVLELHEKFFNLPFQATKCKLAGELLKVPLNLFTLRHIDNHKYY